MSYLFSVRYVIKHALATCPDDMTFFEKFVDKDKQLMERLNKVTLYDIIASSSLAHPFFTPSILFYSTLR